MFSNTSIISASAKESTFHIITTRDCFVYIVLRSQPDVTAVSDPVQPLTISVMELLSLENEAPEYFELFTSPSPAPC